MMEEIFVGGPISCGFFSNVKSFDRYRMENAVLGARRADGESQDENIGGKGSNTPDSASTDVPEWRRYNSVVLDPGPHLGDAEIRKGHAVDHFVELTGWGTTHRQDGREDARVRDESKNNADTTTVVPAAAGVPYWVVRNSWGSSWGWAGWFLLARGKNALTMESAECAYIIPSRRNLEAQMMRLKRVKL
ncbi:unnamed protein product [Amoebophrya sp. A120]|nr:unnamed protein product [Amoebophrya sp. A120]|eukprot:GSA120T00008093001.1